MNNSIFYYSENTGNVNDNVSDSNEGEQNPNNLTDCANNHPLKRPNTIPKDDEAENEGMYTHLPIKQAGHNKRAGRFFCKNS